MNPREKYPDLFTKVADSAYCLEDAREIGALLPDEDDELDALIRWLVSQRQQFEFDSIFHAALIAGRPVDVSVLDDANTMIDGWKMIPGLVVKCSGDVPGQLLKWSRSSNFTVGLRAVCLLSALGYTYGVNPRLEREKVLEVAIPLINGPMSFPGATAAAHKLNFEGVCTLAYVLKHPDAPIPTDRITSQIRGKARKTGKKKLIKQHRQDAINKFLEEHLQLTRYEPSRLMPPTRADIAERPELITTQTRQGVKLGRNDPCHCESGKKYKVCCMDKDKKLEKRVTDLETNRKAGFHDGNEHLLTQQALHNMAVPDMERLDFTKVDTALHKPLVDRLYRKRALEGAVRFFEAVGVTDDTREEYASALTACGREDRLDLARRLAALLPKDDFESLPHSLHTKMALLEDRPAAQAALMEDQIARCLDDPVQLSNTAIDLLWWKMPAVGIALARSALTSGVNAKYAKALSVRIEETRTKSGWPPDDPSKKLAMAIAEQEEEEAKSAQLVQELEKALHSAARIRARSDEKTAAVEAELERNRNQLEQMRKSASTATSDGRTELDLRRRYNELKEHLSRLHEENSLHRKSAENFEAEIADLKTQLSETAQEEPHDEDREEALLGEAVTGKQPLRIPVFPDGFLAYLDSFPIHIRKELLRLIGAMAAADDSAWRGTCPLKKRPDYHRQKVKKRYRVILRLEPAQLRVIDLVHRSEFERRIDRL